MGSRTTPTFTNYALKVDGKLNKSVRGNFTFYENSKDKAGRDAGPTRPPETTWLQTGPTRYYKGEGNFIVGNRPVCDREGRVHRLPASRSCRSAASPPDFYFDDGGVAHNTYYGFNSSRPQHYAGGDGSLFRRRP